MTEDDIAELRGRIVELETRADYLFNELLTVAGRAINAEEENKNLRGHISGLIADIPKSPCECYECGSCNVVSQWFIYTRARAPGLGEQPSRIIVWYCGKHEPQDKDTEK